MLSSFIPSLGLFNKANECDPIDKKNADEMDDWVVVHEDQKSVDEDPEILDCKQDQRCDPIEADTNLGDDPADEGNTESQKLSEMSLAEALFGPHAASMTMKQRKRKNRRRGKHYR